MKEYDSALEALKECLLRDRKSVEAMNLAGQVYARLSMKSKAAGMFQKVLRIAPGHKSATTFLKKMK